MVCPKDSFARADWVGRAATPLAMFYAEAYAKTTPMSYAGRQLTKAIRFLLRLRGRDSPFPMVGVPPHP